MRLEVATTLGVFLLHKLRGLIVVAAVATLCGMGIVSIDPAGAASAPGVTASTINVGIPYIDFAALKSLGVDLNTGNWPHAYQALIANIDAHGGVNGRKVKPFLVAVNPTGTAAAASACTKLVEDDDIFVAISPEQVNCYVNTHHIPAIQGLMQTSAHNAAANFTLEPPYQVYDPAQIAAFDKAGAFKGKKVGLFAGSSTDQGELNLVQSEFKKRHVNIVQSAVDSAPATDQVAADQQAQVIAQRFQSDGVNEVVAVGTGSALWPKALDDNQSAYNPPWVGTNGTDLQSSVDTGGSNTVSSKYVKNMLASVPIPSYVAMWKDPAVQKCVSVIKKAYPSDPIATPTPTSPGSNETYEAPVDACQYLAMFTTIAAAAGKNLTVPSFTKAGYGLRNVKFPGVVPVSFGPNQPAAVGAVYPVKYDSATNSLVISSTPLKS
jgi:hypothetical protein